MRLGKTLLIILMASMALPLPAVADEEAVEIAFLARGDHDLEWEIHAVNQRGVVREVNNRGAISRPAVSPNGKLIAFSGFHGAGDEGRFPLYVINHDGSGTVQLTDVIGTDTDPDWSPDGSQIVFSRDDMGNLNPATCCDIWLVDADGSNETQVPNTQGGINPSWSPDGDMIVFENPSGLFTVTPQGSSLTQIAPAGSRQPDWSPSGETVAFVRSSNAEETEDDVVVVDVQSLNETVIYSPSLRVESPTWVDEDVYVVTFDGYGFDDRQSSQVRAIRASGAVSTVFNPSEEIVFANQSIERCIGMDRRGGVGGGVDGLVAPGDCFGAATASGDFDNDGYDDVAIGVPGDNGAGAVNVLYGGPGGLSVSGDQLITQDTTSAVGSSEAGDAFGRSLAVGDFDDDGFDDLAVGVPEENLGSVVDSGGVEVIYGSGGGLNPSNSQFWSQDTAGIKGVGEADDLFGMSLAAGDFDDDGVDDIAIGAPGEDISGRVDTGAISVLYGSPGGGITDRDHRYDQDSSGIKGVGETDDRFGWSLAAGDFDDDGVDDLALGVPGEDIGADVDTGTIAVQFGQVGVGLTARDQRFDQDSSGIKGVGEDDDLFGWSLAAGDFDDDGVDDLALGVPGEDIGGKVDVGAVAVIYGVGGSGLGTSDGRFDQADAGISGAAEADDLMGSSLAVGDFDGDGIDDLIVGLPGEDRTGLVDAGGSLTLYGATGGLNEGRQETWYDQGTSGVPGANEGDDLFGSAVAAGDFDNDGVDDAVIGAPGEDIGSDVESGAINTFSGSGGGLVPGERLDQGS